MDLIKLHQHNIEDLLARRINHLKRPFVAQRTLAHLDYRLLASLTALQPTHEPALENLTAEKPFALFLQVFYGLQQQQDTTLQQLDENISELDEKQLQGLLQAAQLATITLEPHHWVPQTPELRQLLLTTTSNLPTVEWLQQGDDSLTATCIQHLVQTGTLTEHRALLHDLTDSDQPLTRLAACHALALQGHPESQTHLGQQDPDTLKRQPPVLLAACWLHPDVFFEQGPLCAALTGRPEAILRLMNDMQDAATLHEAYDAWLWLTGRSLPHYPLLQVVDAESRHVVPTSGTKPDIDAARRWWQQRSWQPQQRYFLGQTVDPAGLQNLSRTLTGQCLPLLATHQQLQHLPPAGLLAGFCLAEGMQACRI